MQSRKPSKGNSRELVSNLHMRMVGPEKVTGSDVEDESPDTSLSETSGFQVYPAVTSPRR